MLSNKKEELHYEQRNSYRNKISAWQRQIDKLDKDILEANQNIADARVEKDVLKLNAYLKIKNMLESTRTYIADSKIVLQTKYDYLVDNSLEIIQNGKVIEGEQFEGFVDFNTVNKIKEVFVKRVMIDDVNDLESQRLINHLSTMLYEKDLDVEESYGAPVLNEEILEEEDTSFTDVLEGEVDVSAE